MGFDELVHQRLGECRIVELVVAVATITDQVDDDVALKLLPVADRQSSGVDSGLRVVAIDVKNGRMDDLRYVRRVAGRATFVGIGSKPDLVVDDDVDRAPRPVRVEAAEHQRLSDHTLGHKRRIAVDEDRDRAASLGVVEHLLLGTDVSLDDRVDRLEVAGVERQRHMDVATGRGLIVVGVTEVVLDVAVPLRLGRHRPLLELGQQVLVRFAEHVGQDVQPAAMSHPHHDLVDTRGRRLLDDRRQRRDERRSALQRKPFRDRESPVNCLLERVGGQELTQDRALLLGRQPGIVAIGLHARLQPLALIGVGYVHVLDADRPAVSRLQGLQKLGQRPFLQSFVGGTLDDLIEIGLAEPELGQRQDRMFAWSALQRVEIGNQVTELAIGVDQTVATQMRRLGVGNTLGDGAAGGQDHRSAVGSVLGAHPVALPLVTGEEERPSGIDRLRIFQKLPVERVYVVGIGPQDRVERGHLGPNLTNRTALVRTIMTGS